MGLWVAHADYHETTRCLSRWKLVPLRGFGQFQELKGPDFRPKPDVFPDFGESTLIITLAVLRGQRTKTRAFKIKSSNDAMMIMIIFVWGRGKKAVPVTFESDCI